MAEKTHTITTQAGLSITLPDLSSLGWKKDGYVFRGWGKSKTTSLIEVPDGGTVVYDDNTDLYAIWSSTDYFYLKASEAGAKFSLKWSSSMSWVDVSLEYSTDYKKTWLPFVNNSEYTLEDVGDTMFFKATSKNTSFARKYQYGYYHWYFEFNEKKIAAGGNIMSLLDKDLVLIEVPAYCFTGLFKNATSLVSAPELPALYVESHCYHEMFCNCTNLIKPPSILPALSLPEACYDNMFYGCTSLETLPVIAATTCTGINAMTNMFSNALLHDVYVKLNIDSSQINLTYMNTMFYNHKYGLSIDVNFSTWYDPSSTTGSWLATTYANNAGVFMCPDPETLSSTIQQYRNDNTVPVNWSITSNQQ